MQYCFHLILFMHKVVVMTKWHNHATDQSIVSRHASDHATQLVTHGILDIYGNLLENYLISETLTCELETLA